MGWQMGGDHLWEEVGAIGQVLGSIAVFVTLVYLAIQTNHARREARRAILRNRRNAIREMNLHLATHPELLALNTQVDLALGAEFHPFVNEVVRLTGISPVDASRV